MDLFLKTTVILLMLTAFAGADFACACVRFSIAALRFKNFGEGREPELGRFAEYFLRNSKRAASVTFMARSLLFCGESLALCVLLWIFLPPQSLWACLFEGLAVCFAASVLRYAFIELPAAALSASNAAKTLGIVAPFFAWIYGFFYPAKIIAGKTAAKLFGSEKLDKGLKYDFSDVDVKLRAEAEDADVLPKYACDIIKNAMSLPEISACDVMLPRSQVKFMDEGNTLAENMQIARESGYTRYPLCRESLDDCLGVVNLKDLFMAGENPDLMHLKREIIRVKENEPLINVLPKLIRYELHMALVEDDFGGIIGIITLNDVLSELVGQISEDFDPQVREAQIVSLGGGTYKISGLAPLHRVEDFLDVDFGTDAPSTFGGLVTMSLGRFPKEGERILFKEQRLRVTVDKVGQKRILDMTARIEEPES